MNEGDSASPSEWQQRATRELFRDMVDRGFVESPPEWEASNVSKGAYLIDMGVSIPSGSAVGFHEDNRGYYKVMNRIIENDIEYVVERAELTGNYNNIIDKYIDRFCYHVVIVDQVKFLKYTFNVLGTLVCKGRSYYNRFGDELIARVKKIESLRQDGDTLGRPKSRYEILRGRND